MGGGKGLDEFSQQKKNSPNKQKENSHSKLKIFTAKEKFSQRKKNSHSKRKILVGQKNQKQ